MSRSAVDRNLDAAADRRAAPLPSRGRAFGLALLIAALAAAALLWLR